MQRGEVRLLQGSIPMPKDKDPKLRGGFLMQKGIKVFRLVIIATQKDNVLTQMVTSATRKDTPP